VTLSWSSGAAVTEIAKTGKGVSRIPSPTEKHKPAMTPIKRIMRQWPDFAMPIMPSIKTLILSELRAAVI